MTTETLYSPQPFSGAIRFPDTAFPFTVIEATPRWTPAALSISIC